MCFSSHDGVDSVFYPLLVMMIEPIIVLLIEFAQVVGRDLSRCLFNIPDSDSASLISDMYVTMDVELTIVLIWC